MIKLHMVTVEQAKFIWDRNGAVYVEGEGYSTPRAYHSGDYLDRTAASVERRVINRFQRYLRYPQVVSA